MRTKIFPFLLLSIAFLGDGARADSSSCRTQIDRACEVGMSTNPNTTHALIEAKKSARNKMFKDLLSKCAAACEALLPAEEGRCVALAPKLSSNFSTNYTGQVTGPDETPQGNPVPHKIKIGSGRTSPQEAKIGVIPPNTLPAGVTIAASVCAEVECPCELNRN